MTFRLGDYMPAHLKPRLTSVQRGCFNKVRYPSEGAANAAVRSSDRRAETQRGGPLNAYKCPRCLGWHTGHRRPAVQP